MSKVKLDKRIEAAEPVKLPPTRKDELQGLKDKQKTRTAAEIFKDHQAAFSRPAVKSGWPWLDEHLRFMPESFNVVKSQSNHGKSTFMLNLLHAFAFDTANDKTDCIFITYESSPLRIEERFLNVCAKRSKENLVIVREQAGPYSYNDKASFLPAFDASKQGGELAILSNIPLEDLPGLIDLYTCKDHTLVLFLDYLQIAQENIFKDFTGWERIKEVAYYLERLAVEKKIILFAGSQVNKQGEAREGQDIYNAATSVIDIFNHSHSQLEGAQNTRLPFKPKVNGKSIFTLAIEKNKHDENIRREDYLLFDGFAFEENSGLQNEEGRHPLT